VISRLWHGTVKAMNSSSTTHRRPIPAITHFAVLAAFLLPITFLPYVVIRRQLVTLRRKLDDVQLTAASQQDVRRLLAIGAERDKYIQSTIDKVKREVEVLRLEADRRQRTQITSDNLIRSDLRQLLNERRHARAQVMTLRELGSSLADVAAFMHEVELREGLVRLETQGGDKGGIDRIDRLRSLALQMHDLPVGGHISGECMTDLQWSNGHRTVL